MGLHLWLIGSRIKFSFVFIVNLSDLVSERRFSIKENIWGNTEITIVKLTWMIGKFFCLVFCFYWIEENLILLKSLMAEMSRKFKVLLKILEFLFILIGIDCSTPMKHPHKRCYTEGLGMAKTLHFCVTHFIYQALTHKTPITEHWTGKQGI